MHVITGGTTNNIEYGYMYDASHIIADEVKTEKDKQLYGFYGIAHSLNDAPAIIWLDEELEFVKGELIEPSNTEFLKDWTLSEYNEGTEDQLDYYINTDACKEGDKAYQYSHADKILSEMVIKHIVRRSDDMTVYDKMDADVLLEGKDHHNADTSAEFITDNDCYLVWFAYV